MSPGIPEYPHSIPLDWFCKETLVRSLTDFAPRASEYTFTNLFSWRKKYQFTISFCQGGYLVASVIDSQKSYFSPIGVADPAGIIAEVLSHEPGARFIRVDEKTASVFTSQSRYQVVSDRDNFDYVYKSTDLIQLPGKKYDGKRNFIKRFKIEHEFEYKVLSGLTVAGVLDFQQRWCQIKDCDSVEGLSYERHAIDEIVKYFDELHLIGGLIQVDGVVQAFAIAEKLNPDTAVVHILKANPELRGLYQVILNELISRQLSGFAYINLEQDLGIEGLRKSKLSYQPVFFINKYIISSR